MAIFLHGTGCFTGVACSVKFTRADGPVLISTPHGCAELRGCTRAESVHSTSILVGGHALRTVEHLASALAGLGIYAGVHARVEGGEVPLLDGCASEFVRALRTFAIAPQASGVVVTQTADIQIGASHYRFLPAPQIDVVALFVCDQPQFQHTAVFAGSYDDYAERIAPARTFMRQADADAYLAAGQSATLAPEHVVVIGETLLSAGRPAASDEPARHKLLDLLGDLYLAGGVPRGHLRAVRPGHRATQQAMTHAYATHVLFK